MRLMTLVTLLVTPAVAAAQDPFGDVTNDPLPAEFLHWDAEAYAGFTTELEAGLRDAPGIFGTQFAVLAALPRADHRPHDVQIIYRSGYTQPEIHETKWDTYVILDGTGTVLMGGERVNWVDGLPQDEQRPELAGAQAFTVSPGDILHVPARTWHQVKLPDDASITYALINVFED